MPNGLTVIVAGADNLAQHLESTAMFTSVRAVGSTGGLRDLLSSGQLSPGVDDKVFIFADNLSVDTSQSLEFLVGKLTQMRARVAVLGVTPAAEALVRACPGAGLLSGTVYLNTVLGALAGLPGVQGVGPVENGNVLIIGREEPTEAPATPNFTEAPAPAFGQPAEAPAAPAPAFGQPAEAPAAPAPAFGQPAEAPAAPAPAFGQPAEAPAAPAPAFGQPAEAPAAPAPAAPTPAFGQPAEAPAAPAPAFGQPAEAPDAPVPTGSNPFQPGQVPAARPGSVPAFSNPNNAPVSIDNLGEQAQASTFAPAQAPTLAESRPTLSPGLAPSAGLTPAIPEEQGSGRRGFVITVTAPKGGTGKSTLSLNLAAYLGLRMRAVGKTVAIVDSNFQQADTGKYLNVFSPNIQDLLNDPSGMTPDRVTNFMVHKPQLNLSAMLGPATPDTANPVHFTGRRYTQVLEAIKPNYDYIIIDTPVAEFYHDLFEDFALPQANYILIAAAPNIPTLQNTDAWLRQVTAPVAANGMGLNRDNIGVILNRAEEGIGCSEDEVRRNLAEWNYLGAVPESKEWKYANNAGEIVATKNYQEINGAFAQILAGATGEHWLAEDGIPETVQEKKGGLFSRFRGKK